MMSGLPVFMGIMLLSGTANTLLMKFMVVNKVSKGPGMAPDGFDHPYFQTLLMMIGEFLCLIVYFWTRKQEDIANSAKVPKSIFAVACLFDWTATTLVNMAYGCIAASVVQMTRGAIVIFTCILSVVFLGRRQHGYHLVGVALVFLGITMVSLSAFLKPNSNPNASHGVMLGIGLCLVAQVFQASMIVFEERIMSKYPVPPLQVVGMEGTFGIFIGIGLLCFLNPMGIESTPQAVYQMSHSTPLLIAIIASIFSIAFFNYSGVTVTQQASAVARSTIDVSRTVLIWAVELALGWNSFSALQLSGFIVLAIGTMLYNRLIVIEALDPSEEKLAMLARQDEKKMAKSPLALCKSYGVKVPQPEV